MIGNTPTLSGLRRGGAGGWGGGGSGVGAGSLDLASTRSSQPLPGSMITRFEPNFRAYVRRVKQAFPFSLLAVRTSTLLDKQRIATTKYHKDWPGAPAINTYLKQINGVLRRVAAQQELVVWDFEAIFEPLRADGVPFFADTFHPSPPMLLEAFRLLLESLAEAHLPRLQRLGDRRRTGRIQ